MYGYTRRDVDQYVFEEIAAAAAALVHVGVGRGTVNRTSEAILRVTGVTSIMARMTVDGEAVASSGIQEISAGLNEYAIEATGGGSGGGRACEVQRGRGHTGSRLKVKVAEARSEVLIQILPAPYPMQYPGLTTISSSGHRLEWQAVCPLSTSDPEQPHRLSLQV